jgi:hypothetical protein
MARVGDNCHHKLFLKSCAELYTTTGFCPLSLSVFCSKLLAEQVRQFGDVCRDPPRLIFAEQLGRRFGGWTPST